MRLALLLTLAMIFGGASAIAHYVAPSSYWFEFWYIFPIALAICITVCTFGIEGAILFVPFFALAFPLFAYTLQPVQAVSIGLVTEVFGFASSLIAFWYAGLIDFHIAKKSGYTSVPFALIGGFLSPILPGTWLLLLVGAGLAGMAYQLSRSKHYVFEDAPSETPRINKEDAFIRLKPVENPASKGSLRTLVDRCKCTYTYHYNPDVRRNVVVSSGGIFEGLVGFGIGVFGVSDLVYRRIPIRVAVGTSHFVIMVTALAALAPHVYEVVFTGSRIIPWNVPIMTVPAVLIGGQTAAFVAGKVNPDMLKRTLVGLLMFLAVITVLRALL